ncbi:MAG: glycosyltransferase family 39 protein [Flavobacteriaceae bacterium]|nr:glycosyltransferase family 39 protein [Flavobacteriaceae bacterium]
MDRSQNKYAYLKWVVFGIIGLRALLLFLVPLLDKTEARYGEIARLMHETGNWVMLQFDYGVPFWGKPPLSTWLSAFSFEVFGVNEFAARFHSFLIALLIIWLIIKFLNIQGIARYALAFILLTIPEYLLHAGVTSTDSALLLGVVLTFLSVWKTVSEEKRSLWSYLFFVGIGIGLLAKGPIVIILTAPPIFIWCFLGKGRFKLTFTKLPWILGIIVTAAIAVPWYWLAEKETPGFIDYFIVGEHFKRFTESGWSGDKYGFAKSQPLGMIWLFLLAFAFPWIQILAVVLWKRRKGIWKDPWVSFLLLWMLWTPIFFTISRNVIHTYILPSTIPAALLILHYWKQERHWVKLGMIFPVLVALATLTLWVTGTWRSVMNTDKYLLQEQKVTTNNKDVEVVYWMQKSYSGRFYSQRKTSVIGTHKALDSLVSSEERFFLLVQRKRENEIPERVKSQLVRLDSSLQRNLYIKREE